MSDWTKRAAREWLDLALTERVARALCELRGFDPDDMEPNSDGWATPRWMLVRREVIAHFQMQAAVQHALNTP